MNDLSFFLKELKLRFTLYYNKTHKRFGTLWAEKFKSLLLESDSQAVVAVAAYIDLNPVRAGLCHDPKDYRFCGYAEAVGGNKRAREGLGGIIVRSAAGGAPGLFGATTLWGATANAGRRPRRSSLRPTGAGAPLRIPPL